MDTENALKKIFIEVFDEKIENISDESSQESIENWDSMGMVRLMVAIENEFNVELDILDISELKTFSIVKGALEKKLSK